MVMEYATGSVSYTSSDFCVVTVPIDDALRSFYFHKSIFYMFGVRCDGSMTNILDRGMDVDVCYRIYHTDRKPVILAVWCGDKPRIVDEAPTTVAWYDQRGRVSYCPDDENVLVQNDAGNHTVIIRIETVCRDGLRIRNRSALNVDDEVNYDAIPLNFEHPFGASFQATCAWLGAKPRLVERFNLDCATENALRNLKHEDTLNDIHGIVVTIPNDILAVVEVQLEHKTVKVLLFRSCFEVVCDSIRKMVNVGDALCMCIGYGKIFRDCKQWYARKAFKVCEEIVEVPGDEQEVNVIASSNVGFSVGKTVNNAEILVDETSNVNVPAIVIPHYTKSLDAKTVRDVKAHEVADNPTKPSGIDPTEETGFVSLAKHNVGIGTQTRPYALIDPSKTADVTEKTVRNYVGLGIKSVRSSKGVEEVLEVADTISTYSSVVKEGSSSLKQGVGKAETSVTNTAGIKQQAGLKGSVRNFDSKTCGYNVRQSASVETPRNFVSNPGKGECVTEETFSVGTKQLTKGIVNVVDSAVACNVNMSKSRETDGNLSESSLNNFVGLNRELDMLNNNVSFSSKGKVDCDGSILHSNPPLLYSETPLTGTIARFALDCGCITFKNFKIFVKPDTFYIDGVRCPVKHFVKYAKARSNVVSFEAIVRTDSNVVNADFTHEATCAWVGKKPSLVAFAKYLPPPNLSLLELHDQNFCGVVSHLYLPDSAVVVIHEDATTVIVQVGSFLRKPQHSEGNFITDFVKLNDSLVFKIREIDSKPKMLVAWDVRITSVNQVASAME